MQNRFQIINEFEFIKTLKTIVQAYEEISVIKIQRIRSSVIQTRRFLSDISVVFSDVKSSYKKEIRMLYEQKKQKNPAVKTLLGEKDREVVVLLSANARLYGDIIKKVFHSFLFYISMLNKSGIEFDIVIVGKNGRQMYEQARLNHPFTYFEIPDFNLSQENIKSVVYFLSEYRKVSVFHGKFENILNQEAVKTDISGEEVEMEDIPMTEQNSYFFEPSLEKILEFFEAQVFSLLLVQAIHEGELARLASRLESMENALSNIEKNERAVTIAQIEMKKQIDTKKRQETFAGMSLWST